MTFERILVPTDLSGFSLAALRCAETFAERFGSQITLLHASEFAASMYLEHPLGFYLDSAPAPKRALQERLRDMAREHFAGAHHVDTIVIPELGTRANEVPRIAQRSRPKPPRSRPTCTRWRSAARVVDRLSGSSSPSRRTAAGA